MLWRVQSHRAWSAQCGSHAGREIPWRFLNPELWGKPWKIQHPNFNQEPCLWEQFWTKQLVLQNFGTSGNGPFPTWLLPGRASGQPINKECQHQHAEPFAADLSTVLTPNQSDWTWNAVALQWHCSGIEMSWQVESICSAKRQAVPWTLWTRSLWGSQLGFVHLGHGTAYDSIHQNANCRKTWYLDMCHGTMVKYGLSLSLSISLSIYLSIYLYIYIHTRIFTVACLIYVGYA